MAVVLGLSGKGAADEFQLRATLRGEEPGPASAAALRRALRRVGAAAEKECKAAAAAWREQPSLFTADVEARAAVRGLPAWAAAEAKRTGELWAEAQELVRLSDTYDAQVVVALCESRALARAPLLSILERLERVAVMLRARVPQLRSARAALDALPPESEGWDVISNTPASETAVSEAADAAEVNFGRQLPELPLVVIQAAQPQTFTSWFRDAALMAKGIVFEVLDFSLELAEALARLSGLLPYEALEEACAPWDTIVTPPSPWLAVVEVVASGLLRCKLRLGRAAPSICRLLEVPQLKTGYWKIRGLGAPARMMCAYAGVDCEDVQYEARLTSTGIWSSSEWEDRDLPALLQSSSFAQLPYVMNLVTGELVVQSMSVYLYLGRVLGLGGLTRQAQALNEQVLFHVHTMWLELRDLVYPLKRNLDRDAFRASLPAHFDTLTSHYEKLESWLQQRGTGYFVGWKPCTADFHVWEMLDQQEEMAKAAGFQSPMAHFDLLADFHIHFRHLWRLRSYFQSDDAKLPINNKTAHFN